MNNLKVIDENTVVNFNKKLSEALTRVEVAVVMNDSKFINDFVAFVFKGINHHITLSSEIKETSKRLLDHTVENYTKYISTNLGALNVWYTLSYITNENEEQNQESDQLFYEIFLQIKNITFFHLFLESFTEMFKNKTYTDIIHGLLSHNTSLKIDQEFIFKLAYFLIFVKGISNDLELLYSFLKECFDDAIKNKDNDLLFYLYQPLLFAHNTINLTQNDFSNFNTQIDKKLELYIQDHIISKYKIKKNFKKNNNNKIAFVIDRITGTSIHNVFYNFLKNFTEKFSYFDIYVYNLNWMEGNGSLFPSANKIKVLPVKYIDCHEKFVGDRKPTYSIVAKSIKIRKHMISEKIDTLVMMNGRPEFNFLFTTRTAATQIYWSHGNAMYDVKGIDKRISHFTQNNSKYEFELFNMPTDFEKYNPKIDQNGVQIIRDRYPKDAFILGYIGRLVKMEDEEYLETIANIMKQNPNTIFLACGSGDKCSIEKKVAELGIGDRFYFTGHIDSHIYGHVIDLYLSPFKNGAGEALEEYRNKGKPYVCMMSEEWHQSILKDFKIDEISSDLYSEKELERCKNRLPLSEENKYAFCLVYITHTLDKEDYLKVSLRLIRDEELRSKVIKEYKEYILKFNKKITDNSFQRILND